MRRHESGFLIDSKSPTQSLVGVLQVTDLAGLRTWNHLQRLAFPELIEWPVTSTSSLCIFLTVARNCSRLSLDSLFTQHVGTKSVYGVVERV